LRVYAKIIKLEYITFINILDKSNSFIDQQNRFDRLLKSDRQKLPFFYQTLLGLFYFSDFYHLCFSANHARKKNQKAKLEIKIYFKTIKEIQLYIKLLKLYSCFKIEQIYLLHLTLHKLINV
jgi:hypothetical protein